MSGVAAIVLYYPAYLPDVALDRKRAAALGYRLVDPSVLRGLSDTRTAKRTARLDRLSFTTFESKNWIQSGGNVLAYVPVGEADAVLRRLTFYGTPHHRVLVVETTPNPLPLRFARLRASGVVCRTRSGVEAKLKEAVKNNS